MDPTVPNDLPEREPLPDVTDWAATTNDELEARLRAAGNRPPIVHFDLDTIEERAACGFNLGVQGPDSWSTNPALVTCPVCTAALVDSQLPPEPVTPEHRTVGLEVLTGALRAEAAAIDPTDPDELPGGTVAIAMRVGGRLIDVPELDSLWAADYRKPADILSILLRQARMYADGLDGNAGAELLMPGPDVLAALSGKPFGSYTDTVETRWGIVRDGWYVLVETVVDGRQDSVWLLVESRYECTRPDCTVAGGTSWACAVTTIRGRGVQHLDAFNPCAVRIPATTEVEPR